MIDRMTGIEKKHFLLHYNFPPFSVGEVGRIGATGRKEIGHGMLAERSLARMMPNQKNDNFNFTVRAVAEVLESNGSSSMATICSSSMSIMAAGIPIKKAVAGIAMGLVTKGDKYKILTDIQGIEDHLGDMDFKVAGTEKGITGFQLDIKTEGINSEIMKKALEQAKKARLEILTKMNETISKSDPNNKNTPKTKKITIDRNKIKNVIGAGGRNIKEIVKITESDVDIADNGEITILAINKNKLEKTIELINQYTGEVKVNETYPVIVKRIVSFGAFVEVFPGTEGLLHISEMSTQHVEKVEDVLSEGDKVEAKVIKVDRQGRISFSLLLD